jgi:hypothetical protein
LAASAFRPEIAARIERGLQLVEQAMNLFLGRGLKVRD